MAKLLIALAIAFVICTLPLMAEPLTGQVSMDYVADSEIEAFLQEDVPKTEVLQAKAGTDTQKQQKTSAHTVIKVVPDANSQNPKVKTYTITIQFPRD